MNITQVTMMLTDGSEDDGQEVMAYCNIELDRCFVVHDLKILRRGDGLGRLLFMPDRKLHDRCDRCGKKNPLTDGFCGHCGTIMYIERWTTYTSKGKPRLREEIAHPITRSCRIAIQEVLCGIYDNLIEKGASLWVRFTIPCNHDISEVDEDTEEKTTAPLKKAVSE